jgi:hypothetical protein
MAKQARRRSTRIILAGLGFLSLGIAIIGVVLPGIPTTGPVLLAAYFFSRSSERFDQWLVEHRLFGPIVRDWRAGLGFTTRAKAVSIIAIAVTFSITVGFVISNPPVRIGLVLLALAINTYILRLPTKVSEAPG